MALFRLRVPTFGTAFPLSPERAEWSVVPSLRTSARSLSEKDQAECISCESSKRTKQSLQSAIQYKGTPVLQLIPKLHFSSAESNSAPSSRGLTSALVAVFRDERRKAW